MRRFPTEPGRRAKNEHVLKLTWDTNCLIRLESTQERYTRHRAALREMLAMHDAGEIEIHMAAGSAAENQKGGYYLKNIKPFLDRRKKAGLEKLELLDAPTTFDFMMFDHSAFTAEEGLLRDLHEAMFDNEEFEAPEGVGEEDEDWRAWRNRRVDVEIYWSHITSDGDLLVTTNTDDFVVDGRRERLLELGGRGIEHPLAAPAWIRGERLAPKQALQ